MATLLQLQSFVGRKTTIPGVRRVFLTPYPYLIDTTWVTTKSLFSGSVIRPADRFEGGLRLV